MRADAQFPDVQIQQAVWPNDVLEPLAPSACASNHVERAAIARQGIGPEAEEKDSSIYDFTTYTEGEEGVRLLVRNGFDGRNLWLIDKELPDEMRPLRPEDQHGHFWATLSHLVAAKVALTHGSARKTGPQVLMMHANCVEAAKAHGVLMDHTNGLIEECLRFR